MSLLELDLRLIFDNLLKSFFGLCYMLKGATFFDKDISKRNIL